jgi:hypothetical protein
MTVTVELGTAQQRMERCDHEGATDDTTAISVCSARGKTWPTRFGARAPMVRIVVKSGGTTENAAG